MSTPTKFLFDECIGKPIMEEIARAIAISMDEPIFQHVLDFQKQGEWDEVWIPRIAKEGAWIVVTGDRGRGGKKKGEKLPVVCKQQRITHVVLSKAIHNKNSREKIATILMVWPDLMKLGDAPKGSRHLLRLKGKEPGAPVLIQIDPPPESDEKKKQ